MGNRYCWLCGLKISQTSTIKHYSDAHNINLRRIRIKGHSRRICSVCGTQLEPSNISRHINCKNAKKEPFEISPLHRGKGLVVSHNKEWAIAHSQEIVSDLLVTKNKYETSSKF